MNKIKHLPVICLLFLVLAASFAQAADFNKNKHLDVRVLVDCIGDRVISQSSVITALQQQGVPALHFLPPTLWPPIVHLNLRNHRKILIVDKTQGFAGGINITQKNSPGISLGEFVNRSHTGKCT